MPRPKRRPVIVTGPASRHKIPQPRGRFSPSVSPPDPVTPALPVTRHQQLRPGKSVRITAPAASPGDRR